MDLMKNFRLRAYHSKFHRMFQVEGIIGIGTPDCTLRTSETSLKWADCEKMLYIGEKDKENNPIFQDDILRVKIEEKGKEIIVEGRVVYKECAFKLFCEIEVEVGKIETKILDKVEWAESLVVGNLYNPPKRRYQDNG